MEDLFFLQVICHVAFLGNKDPLVFWSPIVCLVLVPRTTDREIDTALARTKCV